MNKSIIIIIGYFGKMPWYFHYFLHSSKYNPDIQFYIITDQKIELNIMPPNVFSELKSLDEIRQIASQKFGFTASLNHPYKFCDFRPALAYLFPEIIKGYDFWGYGDIDVIYGSIRNFLTTSILDSYDVISVRHDFLPGAFSIFKNCQTVNELFKKSKDFIKVFSSSKHYCFDETNFAYEKFAADMAVEQIESEIESMTHVVKKMHNKQLINAYFDFHVIEGLPGKIKWDNGILTYNSSFEAILYHLIKFKNVCNPIRLKKNIPEHFRISPSRIY